MTKVISGGFVILVLLGCGFIQSLGVLDIGVAKKFNVYGETDYQATMMVQSDSEYELILTATSQGHINAGVNINICDTPSDLICDNPVAKYHNPSGNPQNSIRLNFTAPPKGQIYIHVEWIADKSDRLGEYEIMVQPHIP